MADSSSSLNTFAQGATLVGVSLAWFAIYYQYQTTTEGQRRETISLLKTLDLEMQNIAPWASGDYPNLTPEFWWHNPATQNWKSPYSKIIYKFNHSAIDDSVINGCKKGLSLDLVRKLTQLEQSIVVIECVLDLLNRLIFAQPNIAQSLTQKLEEESLRIITLTNDELAMMQESFRLNHHLHVHCIGTSQFLAGDQNLNLAPYFIPRQIEGTLTSLPPPAPLNISSESRAHDGEPPKINLNSCYKLAHSSINAELANMTSEHRFTPPELWILIHLLFIALAVAGVVICVRSFWLP